ncbi:hypothetical protein H5410_061704, partial [Solanum commersonii]
MIPLKVYPLVPGLLQDEVRVQSNPVGRLIITDQPNQLDNLWGVTGFKRCSPYLLELIKFGPTLLSAFMSVLMFMCPLRNKISELTMLEY